MALIDNLVAYYKLDEATDTTGADSHGSNNLTNSTGATIVSGILSNGRRYSGSGGLSSATPPITTITNFGLSAWLKPNAVSQNSTIAVYVGNDTGGFGIGIGDGSGGTGSKLIALYGFAAWFNSNFTWPDTTTWHHVVLTRDTTTSTIYFDGAAKNTLGTSPIAPNNQVAIGYEPDAGNSPSRRFAGAVDEVGFWSRYLTQDDVTALYNSGSGLAYPFPAAFRSRKMMKGI